MNNEIKAFCKAIWEKKDPADALVFADYLQENGYDSWAKLCRLMATMRSVQYKHQLTADELDQEQEIISLCGEVARMLTKAGNWAHFSSGPKDRLRGIYEVCIDIRPAATSIAEIEFRLGCPYRVGITSGNGDGIIQHRLKRSVLEAMANIGMHVDAEHAAEILGRHLGQPT